MGKTKKKGKKKSEFDDFFETAPTEAQWLAGVSAAAMDTDDKDEVEHQQPAEPAATVTVGEVMDTSEGNGGRRAKLGVVTPRMKRGQKSKAQKLRKSSKLEKALALNERLSTKVTKNMSAKQRKASLKSMY